MWDEKNGLPNTIIYKDEEFSPQQPIYQDKRNKFTNYYNRFNNGETAFLWLYTSLSNDNKQTLINFITKK